MIVRQSFAQVTQLTCFTLVKFFTLCSKLYKVEKISGSCEKKIVPKFSVVLPLRFFL
jgi:hypothetical protein